MTNLFDAPADQQDTSLRDEIYNKWKTKFPDAPPELLNAKTDSDLYVKTLERQKDELRTDYLAQREELLAKAKFEELIDRFEKAPKDLQVAPPTANEVESRELIDIDKKVRDLIEETRRVERQTANANLVQTKLKERFGNNYHGVLRDTGLSDKQIQEIAQDSPEAIFRLVGLNDNPKESFQTPPRSNQRNDTFAPKGQTKRDWNYYQELKKTNPKLYLDPKLSVQMHNDAIEQGEAFYG